MLESTGTHLVLLLHSLPSALHSPCVICRMAYVVTHARVCTVFVTWLCPYCSCWRVLSLSCERPPPLLLHTGDSWRGPGRIDPSTVHATAAPDRLTPTHPLSALDMFSLWGGRYDWNIKRHVKNTFGFLKLTPKKKVCFSKWTGEDGH